MYWTFLAAAMIVLAALWWFLPWRPPLTLAVTLLGVPRLHDIGRSGWFALGIFAPSILIETHIFPDRTGSLAAPTLGVILLMAALVGAVVWLGAVRGQPGANKFGPPCLPGLRGQPVGAGQ